MSEPEFETGDEAITKKRSTRSSCLWVVGLIALSAALLVTLIEHNSFYYKNVAERCRKQMLEQADLGAIRLWMATLPRPLGSDYFHDPNHVPEAIKTLRFDGWGSQGVYALEDDGVLRIRIYWGSGFGHWGIVVGPESMPTPSTSSREYVLPMSPGAYAWHEIQ